MTSKNNLSLSKFNKFVSNLINKPVSLLIIILLSMIFCFLVAGLTGSTGQWFLLILGSTILLIATQGIPGSWKVQLLISFILAIPVEYFLSVYLGWYSYDFATVPPWVFIGHSIVHFGALALGLYFINNKKYRDTFIKLSLIFAILYGVISLLVLQDQIGLICSIIIAFLIGYKSKYQLFYASFWMLVVWLEWWGVFFNQWHWSSSFIGLSQANPPANIVAGYCAMAWLTIYISDKIMNRYSST